MQDRNGSNCSFVIHSFSFYITILCFSKHPLITVHSLPRSGYTNYNNKSHNQIPEPLSGSINQLFEINLDFFVKHLRCFYSICIVVLLLVESLRDYIIVFSPHLLFIHSPFLPFSYYEPQANCLSI